MADKAERQREEYRLAAQAMRITNRLEECVSALKNGFMDDAQFHETKSTISRLHTETMDVALDIQEKLNSGLTLEIGEKMKDNKSRSGIRLLGKGPDFVAMQKLFSLRAQEEELISSLFKSMVERLDGHKQNPQCQICLCGDMLDSDELELMALPLREYFATQEQDKEPLIHTGGRHKKCDQVCHRTKTKL